ncbi:hypothetical protein BT93_B0278 [Corymbia citriodora subsp. variegata]|nr:hypothetical protein BT93_B0278 [Corymbia citriodora subsp. variegata]
MGCFLACFGSLKDGKRWKQRRKVQPRDHHWNSGSQPVEFAISSGQEIPVKPVSLGSDVPCVLPKEPLSCSTRKKVTFDTNVKTYEHGSHPDDDADAGEDTLQESRDMVESDDNYEKLSQAQCASEDSSVASSARSYLSNHRYQKCRDSDHEDGDLGCNMSDLSDDDYDDKGIKENLSFDQEARMSFDTAPALKEVSFSFKAKPNETKKSTQEVPVDASLSNWLPSSVTTPIEKKSVMTLDLPKRPILGALTVEELRHYSAKSSPRKSPSGSPDKMPIIGTVGTYWSQSDSVGNSCLSSNSKYIFNTSSFEGIPNTTSKYREDKKVNWHSTPFETRLERALNKGAHQL